MSGNVDTAGYSSSSSSYPPTCHLPPHFPGEEYSTPSQKLLNLDRNFYNIYQIFGKGADNTKAFDTVRQIKWLELQGRKLLNVNMHYDQLYGTWAKASGSCPGPTRFQSPDPRLTTRQGISLETHYNLIQRKRRLKQHSTQQQMSDDLNDMLPGEYGAVCRLLADSITFHGPESPQVRSSPICSPLHRLESQDVAHTLSYPQ